LFHLISAMAGDLPKSFIAVEGVTREVDQGDADWNIVRRNLD